MSDAADARLGPIERRCNRLVRLSWSSTVAVMLMLVAMFFRRPTVAHAAAKGIERSGYVTDDKSGNVFLSLDDRNHQEAVFVTDPDQGTVFRMWHGDDSRELRLDPDENGPSLKLIRNKRTVYQQPASTPSNPRE